MVFQTTQNLATCKICSSEIPMKHFSTSNLIFHLKRHHGFLKKYNAWKIYEELSGIKEERLKKLKRKNSEVDSDAQPISKQPKIASSLNPPYGPQHPRQKQLENEIKRIYALKWFMWKVYRPLAPARSLLISYLSAWRILKWLIAKENQEVSTDIGIGTGIGNQ